MPRHDHRRRDRRPTDPPDRVESSAHSNVQATSLCLSLSWLPRLNPGSRITFYAVTPGAFVDLAADLTFALGGVALQIDDDITNAPIAGLTSVETLTGINHAAGILVPRSLRGNRAGRDAPPSEHARRAASIKSR